MSQKKLTGEHSPEIVPVVDLRELLEERGVPVAVLAERVGVTRAAAYKWLRGSKPRIPQMPKIAEALGVTLDELRAVLRDTRGE